MIIVDASFLASALVDDTTGGDKARARITGEELAAPVLIDLEVASVLRKAIRVRAATDQRATQALEDLAALPLERAPLETLMPRVWELRHNYTPYDASYIALAELFRAPLLTADARMARGSGARCEFEVHA
jgi:predicted nucleic acid-binding protein